MSFMRFYHILPFLIVPFISGCFVLDGTTNMIENARHKYQEPTSGKTANLRAFYDITKDIAIYPYANSFRDIRNDKSGGLVSTQRYMSGLNTNQYKPKSIQMPFPPSDNSTFAEYKVPVDHPIIISMFSSEVENHGQYNVIRSCKKHFYQAHFEENKNYGVQLSMSNGICFYQIFEYQADGSRKHLENRKLIR